MSFEPQVNKEKSSTQSAKSNAVEAPPFATDWGNPSVVYDNAFADAEHEEEGDDEVFEPVSMPVPKVKSKTKAVPVRTDRAPTTDEVMSAERPDLSGASTVVLEDSTKDAIDKIYELLSVNLALVKTDLLKTPPPATTPFGITLVTWAVQRVATLAVGYIGGFIAEQLASNASAAPAPISGGPVIPRGAPRAVRRKIMGEHEAKVGAEKVPAVPNKAQQAVTTATAAAAPAAGTAIGKHATASAPPTAEPVASPGRAAPGGTLLDEFIAQQTAALMVSNLNAKTTIALVASAAPHSGMVELNEKLNALLQSSALQGWFKHKVTMEWLNCLARASMGPRKEDQTTDLIGANTVDGIAAGGTAARQQWQGTAGFVEITLKVPETVNGLTGIALQSARIPSSFGGAGILKNINDQIDANGAPYSLATMPVYRRISIQTGKSKLTVAHAFVITPDGQIEADLTNPALAAIGRGAPVELGEQSHVVGGTFGSEEKVDENAWSKRMIDGTHALHGAHMVRDMLRRVNPMELK